MEWAFPKAREGRGHGVQGGEPVDVVSDGENGNRPETKAAAVAEVAAVKQKTAI
jgi:hypothetical protein